MFKEGSRIKEFLNFIAQQHKWGFVFFGVTSIPLIIIWISRISYKTNENDGYLSAFSHFLEVGWYQMNVEGTSSLYYLSLGFIAGITDHPDWSFLILNTLSQGLLLILGLYLILFLGAKIKDKSLVYGVMALYSLRILVLNAYSQSSNDCFLGVFILLSILLTLKYLLDFHKQRTVNYAVLGLILGCALSIRPTAFLFISAILILLTLNAIVGKFGFLKTAKNFLALLSGLCLVVCVLNFPSIIENHTLSFYDKNPTNGNTWTQRNYLAFKNIDKNNQEYSLHNLWQTNFQDVEKYHSQHTEKLPKDLFSVIKKDPLLYVKVMFVNLGKVLIWPLRFFGILFLFVLFGFRNPKPFNAPLVIYTLFSLSLCILLVGLVEFRWYLGYEVLIPLSFLGLIHSKEQSQNAQYLQYCKLALLVSLMIVSVLNVRSIIIYL